MPGRRDSFKRQLQERAPTPKLASNFLVRLEPIEPFTVDLAKLLASCDCMPSKILEAAAASINSLIGNGIDPDDEIYRNMQDAIGKVAAYCRAAERKLTP